ncbi:hypothetical protein MTR62_03795 [Novosphingobium sp. 1949]|uniref:DUF883 domain-containing protein n=1 Tax=Novosphingobium organovorum TaxID=2930092 RepID=A0ABT0B9W4_9SPHN|nr:hypothetical protein [Novosphingobium organovorum]MCJ2181832.1 hypothetical protein [Novosphingobium organovorum]
MVDSTETTADDVKAPGVDAAKSHFTKAMDEAKAGAQALADQCLEKFAQKKSDLGEEAKERSGEARTKAEAFAADAKVKAGELALEGKAQTSKAIVRLSKVIDDNVAYIDDKAGAKYGDYVRTASKSMQDAAVRLDEKSFEELGEDARTMVRQNPLVAVGMAVATGYLLGRLFSKGK